MTVETDKWIDETLSRCTVVAPDSSAEAELADILVKTCYANKTLAPKAFGQLLASAFDLLVAGQYYGALSHSGWFYCPGPPPRLFFHYTNTCPRHVLTDTFHFHPSNKPESGKIGTATARLLLLFFQALYNHHGHAEIILRGTEPVDSVVVNHAKRKILFAEIKASPLLTLPVSTTSEALTEEVEGESIERGHAPVDNTRLFNCDLQIMVPQKTKQGLWTDSYYSLGRRKDARDRDWGYRGLARLIKSEPSLFRNHFSFWREALKSYHPRSPRSIFWLTNACGTPTPLPQEWPKRRRGEGYESVSDTKTSVGMDRTDDIKKGIYQVLKLGSVGKPGTSKWDYKVGLISNIHAARHFDEYLASLKDVVWTLDATGKAKRVSDLPANQALFNLFDGIVALTVTLSRDDWITAVFGRMG